MRYQDIVFNLDGDIDAAAESMSTDDAEALSGASGASSPPMPVIQVSASSGPSESAAWDGFRHHPTLAGEFHRRRGGRCARAGAGLSDERGLPARLLGRRRLPGHRGRTMSDADSVKPRQNKVRVETI
jgi:hypothetical protein